MKLEVECAILGRMFGYLDESGAPGRAAKPNDYFVVSLVIFKNRIFRDKAIGEIEQLRLILGLPIDYEFHCSRNTNKVQNAFIDTLRRIDFTFITIAMKKDESEKTVTNLEIAKRLVKEIEKHCQDIKIEMDINPRLYSRLKSEARKRNYNGISIREKKSKGNFLIQVADYVANISSKRVKRPDKTKDWYGAIRRKCLKFIVIPEQKM